MSLIQMVVPRGRIWQTLRINIHLDDCRVHSPKVTALFISENQLLYFPHPNYSSDLPKSEFWLFGRIKIELGGHSFAEPEELLECVRKYFEGIRADELTASFAGRIDRVRWVIIHHGQYYSS
jgi:hypothetical protein